MPGCIKWLILACALAAGMPAQAAEPVFPLGLRIGVVPPPGLVASTTFQGFEDRDRSVAMILSEMPPDAYPAMDQAFTIEALKAKGIEAETREDVPLKEGHGFIVVARQQMGGVTVRKWALIAGTGALTAIITLQVPEAAAAAYPDAACRASLASFVVRAKVPADEQLALLPYELRDPAGFRIVRALADGSALLTDGPNDTITAAVSWRSGRRSSAMPPSSWSRIASRTTSRISRPPCIVSITPATTPASIAWSSMMFS
jgi:hypothetical protein